MATSLAKTENSVLKMVQYFNWTFSFKSRIVITVFQINLQSLEDTQVGYILQKSSLDKYIHAPENKLAKLRRDASRVHFAKIRFG